MRESEDELNTPKTLKEELDALANEFMDCVPTCVCAGCEVHGCYEAFCRDATAPGAPESNGVPSAPLLGVSTFVQGPKEPERWFEDGGGSGEDQWEVETRDTKLDFYSVFTDIGGEG